GVLLALLLFTPAGVRAFGRWSRVGLDLLGIAGLIALALFVARIGEYSAFLYRGGFLAAAVASAAVVAAATQRTTVVGRTLALPPLVGLGKISYGVYLFHWPIFLWVTATRTGL